MSSRTMRRIIVTALKQIEINSVYMNKDQAVSCRVFDVPGTYELMFKKGHIRYESYQEACEDFTITDYYYD